MLRIPPDVGFLVSKVKRQGAYIETTFLETTEAWTVGHVGPTYKCTILWQLWCFQGLEPRSGTGARVSDAPLILVCRVGLAPAKPQKHFNPEGIIINLPKKGLPPEDIP